MKYYIYLFLIYAIIGWFIEVPFVSIKQRKFVNRGFMLGPVIPIYAFGGLFMTIFLSRYIDDTVALFIMSFVLCGILEYATSYLLEKIFKLRWWDYSKKKYNINGRVTLGNAVLFGILGTITLRIVNPHLLKLYNKYNGTTLNAILIILCVLFVADFIISFILTYNIKIDIKNIATDSTEEIKKEIKKIYFNKTLKRRIINAFPNFKKYKKD